MRTVSDELTTTTPRELYHQDYGGKILERIKRQVPVEVRIDKVAGVDQQHRVAISGHLSYLHGTDTAGATGSILDNYGLPQALLQALGHFAGQHVRATPSGGIGATKRIGLLGYSCAVASAVSDGAAKPTSNAANESFELGIGRILGV